MLNIGAHISIAGGFEKAAQVAVEMKAKTFQYFSRNPRGGAAKEIDEHDIAQATKILQEHDFVPLIAHAPYTLNLCSVQQHVREFGDMIFREDLQRLKKMPPSYYVFHPGSRKDMPLEEAVDFITATINVAVEEGIDNLILLEGMSGKGSEVGSTFEELRLILDGVVDQSRVGVCLDTCHMYSAGYDIVNRLDDVFEEFDRIVGLNYLKAVHINDSMHPLGAKKDRHAKIGEGTIGLEAIVAFVNHPVVRPLVKVLETPNDEAGYAAEIELLKQHYQS